MKIAPSPTSRRGPRQGGYSAEGGYPTPNPEKLYKYHSVAKTTETCFRMLDTLQRGVQWEGGAVNGGGII